jgi:hypothetical protein
MRPPLSYFEELARLRRATKRAQRSFRSKIVNLSCCVCNATPAPMTRFGPRCQEHAPTEVAP